jgi:hypothetical protein
MMMSANLYQSKFDFDSGYLAKSPCKDCPHQCDLPHCAKDCRILSQLQTLLISSVPCSCSFSELESYTVAK